MEKPFLLMAGKDFEVQRGTDSWKGRFGSYEEALKAVTLDADGLGGVINEVHYDWIDIVDLNYCN